MSEMRLQKLLSVCGVSSRRKAEELIEQGKVKVNGHPAGLGDKADLHKDIVTVSGKRISLPETVHYILLNKPRGYITTMSDEMGRKCVAELVKGLSARVFPVGRLDRESEGMLLLTNDGEFANAIIHPARHIPKVYRVTLRSAMTDEQMEKFRTGMLLEGETRPTAPAEITVVTQSERVDEAGQMQGERVVVEIVLYEGRNRQIRRMFEQLGIEVARLRRTAIGNIKLGVLPVGKWRELEPREVASLLSAVGKKEAAHRGSHSARR